MIAPLLRLIGTSAVHVELLDGCLYIGFSEESRLSIFNRHMIKGNSENVDDMIGSTLVAAYQQQQKVVLEFSSGQTLEVDLSDAGFIGSEAMTLSTPNQPIVVWP